MENFVTLFDSLFLPQGLALHISMQRNLKKFVLWILCVDDITYNFLYEIKLPNVRLLKLSDYENSELLNTKQNRTKGEYCWTLTPFAPRFVFEADPTIHRVTYIDADLWFRKAPDSIFHEFDKSGKSVLITDHAYAPEYDQTTTSGQFCVQFMIFDRLKGEQVRHWWEQRCLEWCYARVEDNKFGDQKYLDSWPDIFPDLVHILIDKELALAPWNAIRYPYGKSIFYHFHSLRITDSNHVSFGSYKIPKPVIKNIYNPYLLDLRNAVDVLKAHDIVVKNQGKNTLPYLKIIRKIVDFLRTSLISSRAKF